MSTLLLVVGFAAQCLVITSLGAIVISSVCLRIDDSALISEDHPSGAVVPVDDDGSNATLSDTARVTCAKSMASSVYVTTIDESSVSSDDYNAMTVVALKALCKSRGVKRYSSLRKSDLVELLSAL
jgi:hypothetical protein